MDNDKWPGPDIEGPNNSITSDVVRFTGPEPAKNVLTGFFEDLHHRRRPVSRFLERSWPDKNIPIRFRVNYPKAYRKKNLLRDGRPQ